MVYLRAVKGKIHSLLCRTKALIIKQKQVNAVERTGNQNNQIKPCRFVLQQHGLSDEIFNINTNDPTHPALWLQISCIIPLPKRDIIPRVSHISCYWMQRVKVKAEPTRSATATAMLNSKTILQATRGCDIRHENFCAQASSLRHQITWNLIKVIKHF